MNNYEDIILKIKQAITRFYKEDKELLNYNTKDPMICERTISFRIGMYLQEIFEDYNVDCEYNRHIDDIKELEENRIYPDIIVHKRKIDENNLVWIEIKKCSSSKKLIDEDRDRLKKVTDGKLNYKYTYGVLIILNESFDEIVIEIYDDGKLKEKFK